MSVLPLHKAKAGVREDGRELFTAVEGEDIRSIHVTQCNVVRAPAVQMLYRAGNIPTYLPT